VVVKNILTKYLYQPLSDYYPGEEEKDVLGNVCLLTSQPFDPADSPRELHHILW
jgi:hypothetical protein